MQHIPVLLHEVISFLNIHPDGVYIDGTLGAAGHSHALAEKLSDKGILICCDLDSASIEHARDIMATTAPQVKYFNDSFERVPSFVAELQIGQVDGIILDLGWNMDQFVDVSRGFSFMHDGPLSMNYRGGHDDQSLTAADIVNHWSEESLADLLYTYADERYSRRIARGIIAARVQRPITTTGELVGIIQDSTPASYHHGRIHPATKTFQALRMAVNDELGVLERSLPTLVSILKPGGRLLVITFHSGEDRIVKNFMRDMESQALGERIEKKGITASASEIADNPRARSARLRVLSKI